MPADERGELAGNQDEGGQQGVRVVGKTAEETWSGWRRLLSNTWFVTIIGGLLVTVGGGLLLYYLTKPSTPAPAKAILPAGYYVNGSPGTPHWFLLVSSSHGARVAGTLAFEGQDGQTGLAQTFSGQLQSDLASLDLSRSGVRTATINLQTSPATISLGACMAYLQFVTSVPECTFHRARDLAGDPLG